MHITHDKLPTSCRVRSLFIIYHTLAEYICCHNRRYVLRRCVASCYVSVIHCFTSHHMQ